MLLKNPGFTVVAVVLLALGIGANAAIFSVVNAVLLRSLPYEDPQRLMVLRETKLPQFPEFSVSPGNFFDWRNQATTFESLVAYNNTAYNFVAPNAEPERLRAARATAGLFELLGAKPAHGRLFLDEEEKQGRENVVILSNRLWTRLFGSDPDIIGQSVTMSAGSYTIVGVMPATFQFPDADTELWTPLSFPGNQAQNHGSHYLAVIGRLKPDATVEQARSEMSTIADRIAEQFPNTNAGWSTMVVPMHEYQVRDIKQALLILLGSVAVVLLIACANVANLLLARATARQREMALRTALGASRWRIVRQLLTESILLSIVGGALGTAIAAWGMESLLAFAPEDLPRLNDVNLDVRVLGFTLLVTMATGIIFGLAPAIQASRPNLNETLKEGGRGTTGGHHRVRSSLVIAEVALALVLLISAGLLIRSFVFLQRVDPGFNSSNALAVNIGLPGRKYSNPEQYQSFFTRLLEAISTSPGVKAVGVTQSLPIQGDYLLGFNIQGRPPDPPGQDKSTNYYAVSPGYFEAMGIPLLKGRLFTEQDNQTAPPVVLINETMAKQYFPDEDPIGQRIHVTNGPERFREIVGIVGDVKQYGLARPSPLQTYEPYLQNSFGGVTLVVRTVGDPATLTSTVREKVHQLDKDQPLGATRTLETLIDGSVAQERFIMLLLGVFAAVALVLATVGLYGVVSYSVTQRTHEIGIRMALGAARRDVLRLVVGHGMWLTIIGVAIGLGGALAVTTLLMSQLLFAVTAVDPLTFVAIPLVLAAVALGACFVPARRAMKVDPMVVLRYE
jgi:putative ABC transport system permease protein